MKGIQGWINATMGFRAAEGSMGAAVRILFLDQAVAATEHAMHEHKLESLRIADEVARNAEAEKDPTRRIKMEEIHRTQGKVPDQSAETLHQAVRYMWIVLLSLGLESSHDGPHRCHRGSGRVRQDLHRRFPRPPAEAIAAGQGLAPR